MRLFLKPKNDCRWHKLFKYEPATGALVNRYTRGPRAKRGDVAGGLSGYGYIDIGFESKNHRAHRIIWEMVNGSIPDGYEIDHINGVRNDNRLTNLRLVDRIGNMRNRRMPSNNTTGFAGVSKHKASGKYRVQISDREKVRRHVGLFNTAEEAHAAYLEALNNNGYHANHGRDVSE